MQGAVARPVPVAAGLVERLQQAREGLEVFESLQIGFLDFLAFFWHDGIKIEGPSSRQQKIESLENFLRT